MNTTKLKCYQCGYVVDTMQHPGFLGNVYDLLNLHYKERHKIDLKEVIWVNDTPVPDVKKSGRQIQVCNQEAKKPSGG